MCKRRLQTTFQEVLELTPTINAQQKKIIQQRYIHLLYEFEQRAFFYACLFHTCRFIVTVGSLIVPALLSIQYVDTGDMSSPGKNSGSFTFQIYWTTWIISLLVTTSNGIFTLFKVDKRYFLLHTMLEQLRSEGWQYLQLSGRFSGFYTPKEVPTHENQFLFFCHAIEKLKMKQVEEEYYKSSESTQTGSQPTHANNQKAESEIESQKQHQTKTLPTFIPDGLIPPTPLNPKLQQLLQVLTVDGGGTNTSTSAIRFQEKTGSGTTVQETSSEMPVRSELQGATSDKERILRQTSKSLSETESTIRMGTQVPTESVESQSKNQENA